jgi:hypothetical protein
MFKKPFIYHVTISPLTEMSTRILLEFKGRPAHRAEDLTAICEPIFQKRGNLDVSETYELAQLFTGIDLPYL